MHVFRSLERSTRPAVVPRRGRALRAFRDKNRDSGLGASLVQGPTDRVTVPLVSKSWAGKQNSVVCVDEAPQS